MSGLWRVDKPTSGVHSEQSVAAHVGDPGNATDLGAGTLYISESCLCWQREDQQGLSVSYEKVSIHAVSRDLNSFPQPCLYVMWEGQLEGTEASNEEEEDEGVDDCPPITELRFVPTNPDVLDSMFSAMNECQALNPDPQEDPLTDEDDEVGYYDSEFLQAGGDVELTPEGQATLQRLENMMRGGGDTEQVNGAATNGDECMDQGQFDDADDMQ